MNTPSESAARAAASGSLEALVAAEQARPVAVSVEAAGEAIRERWGGAVRAVAFYGSCLRGREDDSELVDRIHDFYAVVDGYREARVTGPAALAAALLPPNVYAVTARAPGGELRCKVALISVADFERGVRSQSRSYLWARFAQPTRVVYVRDPAARDWLAAQTASAVRTAFAWGLNLQTPRPGTARPFESTAFWRAILAETIASEWRTEAASSMDDWLDGDGPWLASISRQALVELQERREIQLLESEAPSLCDSCARVKLLDRPFGMRPCPGWMRAPRRWLSRGITALALAKGTLTYADWRSYAAGKLARAMAERRADRRAPSRGRGDPARPGPGPVA